MIAVDLLLDSVNSDSYLSSDISNNESNILETSINGTQDQTVSPINYSVTADCFETISEAGTPAPSCVDKSEYLTSSGVCSSLPGQVASAHFCQPPSYSSTSTGRLPSNNFSLLPSEASYYNTPGGQSTADEYCQSPSCSSTSRGRFPSNDFSLPPSETSYWNTPGGQSTAGENCQSPFWSSTSRGRLPSNDFSLPLSETSYCNTPGGQSTADVYCQSSPTFSNLLGSPETSDEFSPVPSQLTPNSISEETAAESSVSAMVHDVNPETLMSNSEDFSMEEVERSVSLRDLLSVNVSHPCEKPGGSIPLDKNAREKLRIKESGKRYRMKKKQEMSNAMDKTSTLESQLKDLQRKYDSLVLENKYLKSLLEKKGGS